MSTKEWRDNNKDRMRKYRREWYYKNRPHATQKVIERKQKLYLWLREYKHTLKCNRCGENFPACLEFHHTDPSQKEETIARAINRGWGKERIIKEMEKCEVLCANCHRKVHHTNAFVV